MSVKCGCVFLEVDGIIWIIGAGSALVLVPVVSKVLCGGNRFEALLFHLSGSHLNLFKSWFLSEKKNVKIDDCILVKKFSKVNVPS